MLRLCLNDMKLFQLLFRAAEDFARAQVPDAVMKAFMSATMTAQKPEGGGVRGIATGTSLRRLVAKCLARQFGKAVESACAPFQFCSFHKSRHRLRGARGPSPDRREPHDDRVVN